MLKTIIEFAIRELGGVPDDIIPYTNGTYGVVYGSSYNYDREEYTVRIDRKGVVSCE